MAWNIHERGFTIPKTISHCKKWKIWNILCLQLLIWGKKMVVPLTSPGRIIVVLFWTKYAVLRQIKSGIHYLIIRRGQSNYSIVSIFVSFERKGYYCVVFVGQLIFDCRSYCGLSRRMQGLNPCSKTDELPMPSFDSQSDRAFAWQSDRVLRIVCQLF